ncbi:MAG: hypothetical protein H0U81_03905 [Pyrinomonadaceae bacterium]|nr:hypothetical protein [Pyrinomonadaceae bacterium]MBA3713578.1 hypothetical protein [Pyrinomonadaceae bacterium]
MSESLTPIRTEDAGWVIAMPPDMARVVGVAENSQIALYIASGKVVAEILPPAPPEIKEKARRIADKFQDAFAEMKRRSRRDRKLVAPPHEES